MAKASGTVLTSPKPRNRSSHKEYVKTEWIRTSRKTPCPICRGFGYCEIAADGSAAHCMKVAGDKEIAHRLGGWIHRLYTSSSAANQATAADLRPAPAPAPAPARTITPDQISEIFKYFITAYPLTAEHRAYLEAEGIDAAGCGSFNIDPNYNNKRSVCSALVNLYGAEVCNQHPLFKENRAEPSGLEIVAWAAGILYPAINEYTGLVLGAQLRKDNPAKGSRYIWLSNDGKGGTPLTVLKPTSAPDYLVITEGYKKAAAARSKFGCSAISLAGVEAYNPEDLAEAVRTTGAGLVAIAFDADKKEKTQVARAEQKLAARLKAANPHVTLRLLEWPAEAGKGLDDAIKSGTRFNLVEPAAEPAEVMPNYPPIAPDLNSPFILKPEVISTRVSQKYLSSIPLKARATLVQSGKNTGKTEQTSKIINAMILAGGKVLSIGHRVALQQEAAQRHGLAFYQDFKTGGPLASAKGGISKQQGLAITADSLLDLDTRIFKDIDLLVIDESEQVLGHLTGETVKPKRQQIQAIFEYFIKTAKKVLFLDADLSSISYNFVTRLIPPAEVEVYVNEYKSGNKTFFDYEKKADLKHRLLELVRAGARCYVATNSKDQATKLFKMIEAEAPDRAGLLVTSTTVGTPDMQGKIKRINETVISYDYLVTSPTLGTGVDIKVKHFDHVFILAENGVNTHTDLLQQAGRVRNPLAGAVHCWISPSRYNRPTDPERLKANELEKMQETALQIGVNGLTGERYLKKDPDEIRFLELWLDLRGARNFSFNNLKALFLHQAAAEGNTIKSADAYTEAEVKPTKEAYIKASEEVEAERLEGIIAAPSITPAEFEKLKDARNKTPEEEFKYTRHQLEKFYGIEITAELVKADDKGRTQGRVISYINATDLDHARARDKFEAGTRLEWNERENKRIGDRVIFAPDLGHHTLKALMRLKILAWAGLRVAADKDLITNFKPYSANDLRARGFCEKVYQHRADIERYLGITVKSDLGEKPTEFLHQILAHFGIKIEGKKVSTGRTLINKNGKEVKERIYQYTISAASLKEIKELAEAHRQALAARSNPNAGLVLELENTADPSAPGDSDFEEMPLDPDLEAAWFGVDLDI
jgi:hypothetical protein